MKKKSIGTSVKVKTGPVIATKSEEPSKIATTTPISKPTPKVMTGLKDKVAPVVTKDKPMPLEVKIEKKPVISKFEEKKTDKPKPLNSKPTTKPSGGLGQISKPEDKNPYNFPFSDEKIAEIENACKTDNCAEEDMYNLDVCFMLDCTGSMGSYITMAREKIGEIMEQLKAQYTDCIVRVGMVAYRDFCDKTRFEILEFNASSDIAKAFIGKLQAEGGGDSPEDINGAMQLALYEMKWKYPTRMLYHISDAPCHGKKFHTESDDHPNGHKQDAKWDRLMQGLKNLDISYLYFDIDSKTEKMYNEFKKIYDATGEEKANLIFTREVLKGISNQQVMRRPGMARDIAHGGAIDEEGDMAGGGGGEAEIKMKAKMESYDYFTSKTVETAKVSRMVNVDAMKKKKAK